MPPRATSRSSALHGERKKLYGCTEPRLYTPPLRPLSRRTSYGYEVADFADLVIGEPLLPWQRWLAIHALEKNPDGSFRFRTIVVLVARQNGKSHLARVLTLWRMFMYPGTQVLGVAQELGLAKHQWTLARDTVRECPDLNAEWGSDCNVNGQESFTLANKSAYKIKASNRRAGRGLSNNLVIFDELREQYDSDAWSAVYYTTMARPDAQILAMSNAGDDRSIVLNNLREAALAETDPSVGLFEWSAPDGCDPGDRKAWAQANPSLGRKLTESAIMSAKATSSIGEFRTEVLCQRVESLDGAIDFDAWRECSDPGGTIDIHRDRLAACFDMAPDGQHATLAVAAITADGRPRVQLAGAWTSSDDARAELPGLLDRIKPQVIGWYPAGPAGAFHAILRARPDNEELSGTRVPQICQGLADLTRSRRVIHAGEDLLNAHIRGASKQPAGDGWRFTRRGGPEQGHVDAAYAAAGAVDLALTLPPRRRANIRIIS